MKKKPLRVNLSDHSGKRKRELLSRDKREIERICYKLSDVEICKLLEKGIIDSKTINDANLLNWCSYNNHIKSVKVMLKLKEVNPNMKWNLNRAKQIFSDVWHRRLSRIRKSECRRATPLGITALLEHVELVKTLLLHGVDVSISNYNRKSPSEVAKTENIRKMIDNVNNVQINKKEIVNNNLKEKNVSIKNAILIPFEKIEYLRDERNKKILLGRGSSGEVYKCKLNSEIIALKEINLDLDHNKIMEIIQREIKVMQHVQHPLIINVHGYTKIDKLKMGIVLEFIDGKDLHKTIALAKLKGICISNVEKWHFVRKVVEAVHFLHWKGVRHRDIKTDNFLLSKDKKTIKLCDFGMAKVLESTSSTKQNVGTVRFTAPESFEKGEHTFATDVFSLGMTIFEIVNEERPFQKFKEHIAVIKCFKGDRPEFKKDVPLEFKEIFNMCTAQDPLKRATTENILGYIDSKNIEFIQKYSTKGKMTILNLSYFFGKAFLEKKEKGECVHCLGDGIMCYKNLKCNHLLCSSCILARLKELKKSLDESIHETIQIKCKNGCKHVLSYEWIAEIIMGAGVSSEEEEDKGIPAIIEMMKEIEKKIYFLSCVFCKTYNDKRLIGEFDLFSICGGCKSSLCKLCSHKFDQKKNVCSNEGCDLSGNKFMILETHRTKMFPFHFNNHSPGMIPFCRLCPKCGEVNYRINDGSGCKHCTNCVKCSCSFCFICLCVGKPIDGGGMKFDCGKDPWGYCQLAPFQTLEERK